MLLDEAIEILNDNGYILTENVIKKSANTTEWEQIVKYMESKGFKCDQGSTGYTFYKGRSVFETTEDLFVDYVPFRCYVFSDDNNIYVGRTLKDWKKDLETLKANGYKISI